VSRDYFEVVRPTYIENWNAALYALSIPHTDIPLGLDEARSLARANPRFARVRAGDGACVSIERVRDRIAEALECYPGGAFVRLGSRSGKDSAVALTRGLRVVDAETALRMLTDGSRRTAFDLRLALRHDYAPHVFVREWVQIPPWAEFRCFMRGRRLVGISQYDCKNLGHSPEIAENAAEIRTAIEALFEDFRAASHLDDVVFDVFVERDSGAFSATLLELNPFGPETDACLFDWDDAFDGSFRWKRNRPVSVRAARQVRR
jgi:hypothetical protein